MAVMAIILVGVIWISGPYDLRKRNSMGRYAAFLENFIKNPVAVGALAPSSPALARAITSWVGLSEASTVVEFGAGDGAITPFILEKMRPSADFFAIELSEMMCQSFRERLPGVAIYCDSVEHVGKYLAERGRDKVDVIVCGLPWAAFGPQLQDTLMAATIDCLRDGGQFVTYGYLQGLALPAGWGLRKRLTRSFSHVSLSPIVWRNLPPAIVYQCQK